MALVTTPGAANADSYASVAEADAYHAARPFSDTWTAATTAVKESALLQACILLDSCFVWTGVAVDGVQALCWPRTGMLTRNGYAITGIPMALKYAQAEWARQLLAADRLADDDVARQGIESLKAGPVSLSFKHPAQDGVSLDDRNAAVLAQDPKFNYLARAVPDAVRILLLASWYTAAPLKPGLLFEVN